MKKVIFTIPVAGVVATVVALGVMSVQPWSWANTTKNNTINYCLLIGQSDHNDSAARTRGIRTKLGTRPTEHLSNPNMETAKQGKMTFTVKDKETDEIKKTEVYTVNELESKVCVSDTGATWDQATAVSTANVWYAKYPGKITMTISNNDGMAEGALASCVRPEGMPIFGYDSNEPTVRLVQKNRITGTINSNAPAQAAVMNILARRIIDGDYTYKESPSEAEDIYHTLFKGFKGTIIDLVDGEEKQTGTFGEKITSPTDKFISNAKGGFICDILGEPITFTYKPYCHAILVSSNKVTKDNADSFALTPAEQIPLINTKDTPASGRNYNFFQCCYSKTDTYLTTTMNPLLKLIRKQFHINDEALKDMVYGNGSEESETLSAISTKEQKDAYLINMTKVTSGMDYITEIKNITKSDFAKTPIIFYNRQPSTKENKVDPTPLTKNNYTFYVGFDAEAGADKQGEMIVDWLANQYKENNKISDEYVVTAEGE